jgi:YHS domain-containing protein
VRLLGILLILATLALPASAAKILQNIDDNGLGLQGYDPVAFFTDGKPVKGNPQFTSVYHGARYQFASADHKKAFDSDPSKYEPQFGGYCAWGVKKNALYPVKIDAFHIVNDRLLMQYDFSTREQFNKDTQGNLKRADENWPGLVETKGK